MIWTSLIGIEVLVVAVAVQWWLVDRDRHSRHVLMASGFAFFLGLGFNQVILQFVQRVRPYNVDLTHLLIGPSTDPSFPSDHATASAAIAATFLVFGMRNRAALFGLGAVLLMVSRVYVGTHYVSDVLGGALTGAAAAMAVRALYREGTRLDRFITGIL